ncbi:FKBP-type peptidyl-prolyl cis-trans isomerase [uncultured Aquimarina sp.]|uniref:FKBP-type peptidyl-prolyl cis-trans isomerase n=1 Tax=uncultured Aquimarina sp. TaxID=575652 RepID=UPI002632343E|nr:FKBP-type peptidyl-prolyl cis-trans isomerase [uncultured Aquimarina sp.]
MKNTFIVFVLSFFFFSCSSDDDQGFDPGEPINLEYTQEEKDAELEWIENYLLDNDLSALATDSGLHYIVINQGDGLTPVDDDTVIFHFKTSIAESGEVVGESNRENNNFGIASPMGALLEGVREGFKQVNEGSKIMMIVPSYLGYGKFGSFDGSIPPETIMIYDMELNIVLKN